MRAWREEKSFFQKQLPKLFPVFVSVRITEKINTLTLPSALLFG
jgi:hypothetical protein